MSLATVVWLDPLLCSLEQTLASQAWRCVCVQLLRQLAPDSLQDNAHTEMSDLMPSKHHHVKLLSASGVLKACQVSDALH